MNYREFLAFRPVFILRFYVAPCLGVLIYILYFSLSSANFDYTQPILPGWPIWVNYAFDFITAAGGSILISEISIRTMFFAEDRFSWRKYPIYRLVAQFIIISLFAFAIIYSAFYLLPSAPTTSDYQEYFLDFFVFAFLINVVLNSVFIGILLFNEWLLSSLQAQNSKVMAVTAQFEALKAQIDPHFMFNSFNTLSALVEVDTSAATAFIEQMSRVYRYILETREQDVVSIDKELAITRDYVAMLKVRHGERIIFNLPTEPYPEAQVAPMTLQLLVENAVKHNRASLEHPLYIDLFFVPGYLVVSNVKMLKITQESGTGFGLYNLRQRYDVLTTKKLELLDSGAVFCVKVPLIDSKK